MGDLLIFLGIWALIFIFGGIIFVCKPVYIFLFEHEEWTLWRILIACADDFEYQYTLDSGAKRFVNRADNDIFAYIWSDGLASVHFGTEKVLGSCFDKKHSKQMANLLSSRIKEEKTLRNWVEENI